MSMYNLSEYSSDYSDTTGSLWFYLKDEATNFDNNIVNTNNFQPFVYKTKLMGNTVRYPVQNNNNGILKNPAIVMRLIDLDNFWRSLEMSLINCKFELELRWTKHCVLSVLGNENDNINADSNNIIFPIKDTKLYAPVVTLSTKDNQKLSKLLSKGSEKSVY